MGTLVIREVFTNGESTEICFLRARRFKLDDFMAEYFGCRNWPDGEITNLSSPIHNTILAYYPTLRPDEVEEVWTAEALTEYYQEDRDAI